MFNTSQFNVSAIRIVVIRRHHLNHISWGKNDEWPFRSLHIFLPVDNRMMTIPMMNFYNVCVLCVLDWNCKRPIRYGNLKRTLRMLVIVADIVVVAVPVPVPATPSKRVMQMKWNETKWIDAVLRQRHQLGNSARERQRERDCIHS